MIYLKQALTFQPVAVKTRDQRNELLPERENESKHRKQLRFTIKKVEGFIFGHPGDKLEKIQLMGMDYFYLLINLHCTARFIIVYTNLTLRWGGFLVWMVYAITHFLFCPTLAYLYTFFGFIGERSFINLWELMPMFIGVSISTLILEVSKMVDEGLVLSSGGLSMPLVYQLIGQGITSNPQILNCTGKAQFVPAVATPYGISKKYTDLGYNPNGLVYLSMERAHPREHCLCVIWLFVIVLGCFNYQRYRYPMRIASHLKATVFLVLLIIMSMATKNPAVSVITWPKDNYYVIRPYLEVFAFALCDYIPSHWVTIGQQCPPKIIPLQIWGMSLVKTLFGYYIMYTIPFVMESYRVYTNAQRDECMQTFGSHFLFINIPIALHYSMPSTLAHVCYTVFILIIIANGILHLILALKMFTTAICMYSPAINRFRNVFHIGFALCLFILSLAFSGESTHYIFFYMHLKSYYFSYFIISMATACGIGIYGIHRLHADYNQLYGFAFPWAKVTRMLLISFLAIFMLFVINLFGSDDYQHEADFIYWLMLLVCLCPLIIGPIIVLSKRSKYRGCFYPLETWGAASEVYRVGRRRKIWKHMLVYHTKYTCEHVCLLLDPQISADVQEELNMRRTVFGEPIHTRRTF